MQHRVSWVRIPLLENAFEDEIDFAQLIKIYGLPEGNSNEKRYSPAKCTANEKKWVSGDPNPAFISTSYVERQNLTMRMSMRRFTSVTPAMEAKLTTKPMTIEDIVNYAYASEIEAENRLRERKTRKY